MILPCTDCVEPCGSAADANTRVRCAGCQRAFDAIRSAGGLPRGHVVLMGIVLARGGRDYGDDKAERARRVVEYAERYAATGRVFRG